MNICTITDCTIIGKEGKPVLTQGKTKKGSATVSFQVGEKVHDPSYTEDVRFNNFWVNVFDSRLVDKVMKMNLKKGSTVSLVCKLDIAKSTNSEQKEQAEQSEPGKVRFVQGLKLILLDISYVGSSSPKKEEANDEDHSPAAAKETNEPKKKEDNGVKQDETPKVKVINLDENNIFEEATVKRRSFFN